MRKRASLDETIAALQQHLEDKNKLIASVHVGTLMNAVDWLKQYQSEKQEQE